MFHFDIDAVSRRPINPTLVHEALYILVSSGAKYNAGKYPGSYRIHREAAESLGGEEDPSMGEMVEKLPRIVDEYGEYDYSTTILSIDLCLSLSDPLDFSVEFLPRSETASKITVSAYYGDVATSARFRELVEVAEEICGRLEISHASFSSENGRATPWDTAEFLEADLSRVSYFSTELVETIGRQNLLSIPTHRVEEFDDGGLFLIVTPDAHGSERELEEAREQFRQVSNCR